MSRLYVIVGLIGSGKTTLAKRMGFHYIGFDKEWHAEVQQKLRHKEYTDERLIKQAVINMSEIAQKCYCDVVIDGWWTWLPDWFDRDGDRTLEMLQSRSRMKVQLVYLPMSVPSAIEAYKMSMRCAGPEEKYNRTIDARIAYFMRKVLEWGK